MKYRIITNGRAFRVRYGWFWLRTIGTEERVSYDEYAHFPTNFPSEEAAQKFMADRYGESAKRVRIQSWWSCG